MWGGVLVTPVRSGRQPGKEALSGEGDWEGILPEKEGRIRGRAVGCSRNQPSRQNGEKLWDTDGFRALQKGAVAGEREGFAGLGSDVHKVQRDMRDWREEEAGTRYLKRAEEMKKLSGCAELGQAREEGREVTSLGRERRWGSNSFCTTRNTPGMQSSAQEPLQPLPVSQLQCHFLF